MSDNKLLELIDTGPIYDLSKYGSLGCIDINTVVSFRKTWNDSVNVKYFSSEQTYNFANNESADKFYAFLVEAKKKFSTESSLETTTTSYIDNKLKQIEENLQETINSKLSTIDKIAETLTTSDETRTQLFEAKLIKLLASTQTKLEYFGEQAAENYIERVTTDLDKVANNHVKSFDKLAKDVAELNKLLHDASKLELEE